MRMHQLEREGAGENRFESVKSMSFKLKHAAEAYILYDKYAGKQ